MLGASLNWVKLRLYRRTIERALALSRRSSARRDGLRLQRLCGRLEIHWRARDVHPWDRERPARERAHLFLTQSLADTEAAISEIFQNMPQLDVLDLTVLHPDTDEVLLAGTVTREALSSLPRIPSIRMRLSALGIRYLLPDPDEITVRLETSNAGL